MGPFIKQLVCSLLNRSSGTGKGNQKRRFIDYLKKGKLESLADLGITTMIFVTMEENGGGFVNFFERKTRQVKFKGRYIYGQNSRENDKK